MTKRISISVFCLLGLLVSGFVLPGQQVHAQRSRDHQVQDRDCIKAFLLRSPSMVAPGEHFGVKAGVFNCGRKGVHVAIDLFLVTEDLRRINIGSATLGVRSNSRATVVIRCLTPRSATPGRYQLVMAARTRNGPTVLDRTSIVIERPLPDDIDPDIRRLLDAKHSNK